MSLEINTHESTEGGGLREGSCNGIVSLYNSRPAIVIRFALFLGSTVGPFPCIFLAGIFSPLPLPVVLELGGQEVGPENRTLLVSQSLLEP